MQNKEKQVDRKLKKKVLNFTSNQVNSIKTKLSYFTYKIKKNYL